VDVGTHREIEDRGHGRRIGVIQLISDWGDHVKFNLGALSYHDIGQGLVSQWVNQHGSIDPRPWLFDSVYEGHGHREIKAAVSDIRNNTQLDIKQCRFLIGADDDLSDLDVCYRSWPWYTVHYTDPVENLRIDWKNLHIDRCFISLARRPSINRALMTRALLEKFDPDQGLISFGSLGSVIDEIRDVMAPYPVPRLLDGLVDFDRQHEPPDPRFFCCMINVINEASDLEDPSTHVSIFMTEKTFKCFAWRQIPVWNAVPGLVQRVRTLGFDVFDDLLQHHFYDSVQDNHERRAGVIEILSRFCDSHQHDLNGVRQEIWPRIQHNADLLRRYISDHRDHHHKLMRYLINGESI
jgi:hypothetical protein